MELDLLSEQLRKFNEEQLEEIKKLCSTQQEILDWIEHNSKEFRRKYDQVHKSAESS